jgi:hypothetical protein
MFSMEISGALLIQNCWTNQITQEFNTLDSDLIVSHLLQWKALKYYIMIASTNDTSKKSLKKIILNNGNYNKYIIQENSHHLKLIPHSDGMLAVAASTVITLYKIDKECEFVKKSELNVAKNHIFNFEAWDDKLIVVTNYDLRIWSWKTGELLEVVSTRIIIRTLSHCNENILIAGGGSSSDVMIKKLDESLKNPDYLGTNVKCIVRIEAQGSCLFVLAFPEDGQLSEGEFFKRRLWIATIES